jgi:DNA-damage-inducible protein J
MKSETVRARIEPKLKHDVEGILKTLGMNTTEAINLFYTQIKLRHGLPFDVKIPNRKTIKAMKELEADRSKNKLKTYDSAKEMFKDLDL